MSKNGGNLKILSLIFEKLNFTTKYTICEPS